jgi:hypothetical protein
MPTMSGPTQLLPDQLIAAGRAALLDGDRERARTLLSQAVALDSRSDEAWVWLAGTYTDPQEMARCLQRALAINPQNEQAQDGLLWLAESHGLTSITGAETQRATAPAPARAPVPHAPAPASPAADEATHTGLPRARPATERPRRVSDRAIRDSRSWSGLLESALLPIMAGALLGLIRLTTWLWPATLTLVRADLGPIGWGGALGVALAAAATHGLALLPAWIALGWGVSRAREIDRGDLFDSLGRAGHVWTPAWVWSGSLVALLIGLRLGPLGWRLMSVTALLLLATGLVLLLRRLWRLLGALEVGARERRRAAGRLIVTMILAAAPGLLLAGSITAGLLR